MEVPHAVTATEAPHVVMTTTQLVSLSTARSKTTPVDMVARTNHPTAKAVVTNSPRALAMEVTRIPAPTDMSLPLRATGATMVALQAVMDRLGMEMTREAPAMATLTPAPPSTDPLAMAMSPGTMAHLSAEMVMAGVMSTATAAPLTCLVRSEVTNRMVRAGGEMMAMDMAALDTATLGMVEAVVDMAPGTSDVL